MNENSVLSCSTSTNVSAPAPNPFNFLFQKVNYALLCPQSPTPSPYSGTRLHLSSIPVPPSRGAKLGIKHSLPFPQIEAKENPTQV